MERAMVERLKMMLSVMLHKTLFFRQERHRGK